VKHIIPPIRTFALPRLPVTEKFLSALSSAIDVDPKTGAMFWRVRGADSFLPRQGRSQDSMASAFNKQFSGKRALDSTTDNGYKAGNFLGRRVYAHQAVWFLVNGEWPENVIDHINGDGHDNRIANLRHCDQSINLRNAKKSDRNTSGTVGVFFEKRSQRWMALIVINQKKLHLGSFKNKEEAIAARKAANKMHGFTERHGT